MTTDNPRFQKEPPAMEVGGCTVIPSQNIIEFDGHSVRISPRAMDTLVYLAERAGEVVSGNELIDAVWHSRVVNEAQIYKTISQLRRTFSDHGGTAPLIQTVPKRGYRLVAPVAPAESSASIPVTSLAGMSLRAKLGFVTSGALVLTVLIFVGGSMEAVQRLRSEAAPQTFDSGDVFFAAGIHEEMPEERLTDSPEAYTLYLRAGTTALTPGLPNSVRHLYLDQAIALDPNFAEAHARKADVYALGLVDNFSSGAAGFSDLDAVDRLARLHVEKALALSPRLASAYVALGRLHQYRWRSADAQQAYERAFELNPNDLDLLRAYSQFSSHLGNHTKAISLATRGTALAPTHPSLRFRLGTVHLHAGDHESAVAAFRKAIELDPSHAIAHVYLAILKGIRGDVEEALTEFSVAEQSLGDDPLLHLTALMAYGYSRIGHREDAERLARKVETMAAHAPLGHGSETFISLALSDQERALDCLRVALEAIKNKSPDVSYHNLMLAKANVFSDSTLDEPLFREVRDKLGATREAR